MSITYGDHLIDIGHNDITPEQEREIEAREECARRGIDPDEICADGGVTAWMVIDQEMRDPLGASLEVAREYRKMLALQQKRIEALEAAIGLLQYAQQIAADNRYSNEAVGIAFRAALAPEPEK